MAVFTADAAGAGGRGFALVYATFLAISTWLWNSVRRQDRRDHPEFLAVTGRYVAAMGLAAVVMFASAFLAFDPRLVVWAVVVVAWIVGIVLVGRSAVGFNLGLPPTESLVERFGLFTIIVLGEFVFGVVDGLSLPDRDVLTITTGMIALVIGFGFWWIYFDLVGRRLPRGGGRAQASWLLSHLPITMAITAAGAAMVGLIGHAHDARTPASTAWLLSGAVALGLLALIVTERTLVDADRLAIVYRPLGRGTGRGSSRRPHRRLVCARRRGSSRRCSWPSSRCCGSSPSVGSSAPTPGARKRLAPTETPARSQPPSDGWRVARANMCSIELAAWWPGRSRRAWRRCAAS